MTNFPWTGFADDHRECQKIFQILTQPFKPSMEDIIRATPYAFSWLSTKQVCQRWSAFYAAIG